MSSTAGPGFRPETTRSSSGSHPGSRRKTRIGCLSKDGGTKDAWFYETPYRIHRDWETPGRQYKDFMTRNAQHYFKEGITCSSMGVEFSASYMPAGCLFGVNANFFSDDREHLFYVLALLNSTLAKYIIRAALNRTNMVTAGYIKRIPYIEPAPELKTRIADIARTIVASKKANPQVRLSSAAVRDRCVDLRDLRCRSCRQKAIGAILREPV